MNPEVEKQTTISVPCTKAERHAFYVHATRKEGRTIYGMVLGGAARKNESRGGRRQKMGPHFPNWSMVSQNDQSYPHHSHASPTSRTGPDPSRALATPADLALRLRPAREKPPSLTGWPANSITHYSLRPPTAPRGYCAPSCPPARECRLFTPRPCSRWDPRTGTIYSF